jgi:hypothetical protein
MRKEPIFPILSAISYGKIHFKLDFCGFLVKHLFVLFLSLNVIYSRIDAK